MAVAFAVGVGVLGNAADDAVVALFETVVGDDDCGAPWLEVVVGVGGFD